MTDSIVLRTSLRSQWLGVLCFIILTVLGIVYSDLPYMSLPLTDQNGELIIRLPLLLLLALFAVSRPLSNIRNSRYEITAHHIKIVTGLVTLKKKYMEHNYEDILGVKAEQGIVDRILNTGTIFISTKAGPDSIVFKGIYNPLKIVKVISANIDTNRMKEKATAKG